VALIDRRVGLLFAAFIVLLCVAMARAAYLGVFQAGALAARGEAQEAATSITLAQRGEITDRNGIVLALSESVDEVVADPLRFAVDRDAGKVAQQIYRLLNVPEATVYADLTKSNTGYVPVAYNVPAANVTRIQQMWIDGLTFYPLERRLYPQATTAAQVVGWITHYVKGRDGKLNKFAPAGVGTGGIEYGMNTALSGRDGVRRTVYDAKGKAIAVSQLRPTVAGKTIALSIDAALQEKVEQILAGVGAEYRPLNATAIVMNPQTSQILALANWPSVSSNDITSLANAQDSAVSISYEPGSTFKAITVAGALQDGLVNQNTIFQVPSYMHVGTYYIRDAEDHPAEPLSVYQILQRSSNLGAVMIARTLGAQRFDGWVKAFGFGRRTGVSLPGEQTGIVRHWQQYTQTSMYTLPFGQGISVTPMQMMQAYAAIANGGILRTPQIIDSVGGVPVKTPAGHRVISAATASALRSMLRGVLADDGTASGAAIYGWDLAGKTGTAQVAVNGKYSKTKFVSSFIGMVPASNPKLLVAVVVNQPHGDDIYGGHVAAPAFQKIVSYAVPYLGINPCPAPCPASAFSQTG
jgi:cell division protein FtsI (penicillin-binding protein 3)